MSPELKTSIKSGLSEFASGIMQALITPIIWIIGFLLVVGIWVIALFYVFFGEPLVTSTELYEVIFWFIKVPQGIGFWFIKVPLMVCIAYYKFPYKRTYLWYEQKGEPGKKLAEMSHEEHDKLKKHIREADRLGKSMRTALITPIIAIMVSKTIRSMSFMRELWTYYQPIWAEKINLYIENHPELMPFLESIAPWVAMLLGAYILLKKFCFWLLKKWRQKKSPSQ